MMNGKNGMVTELWQRGYAVIPYPQRVRLQKDDLVLEPGWDLALSDAVPGDDVAVSSLVEGMKERFGYKMSAAEGTRNVIRLDIRARAAAKGKPKAIAEQGYLLTIRRKRIEIVGNAPAGLYYGVQTLLQLGEPAAPGVLRLPICRIEDWPTLELRSIHYDTKHHQERLERLKEYIVRASHFKINAIQWEIEDKFAYRRHPVIGAPGAYTKEEMQEIAGHALKHYVEIVPIVQGPSHLAFVLKHRQFAHLREDPRNNYMLCPSNDECYRLLFDMYDELIEATPGCKYFHVGTDEPYFLGDGIECGCARKVKRIGKGGLIAEFITRTSKHLESRGRQVMFWGISPLKSADVRRLPRTLVNSIARSPEMCKVYKARGIQEQLYCPTQGSEPLFPQYFTSGPPGRATRRLEGIYRALSFGAGWRFSKLVGTLVAGWDDSGLNNETFWLGWVGSSEWGWSPGKPCPEEYAAKFMRLFYGTEAEDMVEVHRLLDECARWWDGSWDRVPSRRGTSYYRPWHGRSDRVISLPNLPKLPTLNNRPFFAKTYADVLEQANRQQARVERLLHLLTGNMGSACRNQHNLAVLLSLTRFFEHHVKFLNTLVRVEERLDQARQAFARSLYEDAEAHLRAAARTMMAVVDDREKMYENLKSTWEKGRLPKGQSVGRKKFVHVTDTTKDHWADRRPDLSYLIMWERDLNLEDWSKRLAKVADDFAKLSKAYAQQARPYERQFVW